MKLSISPTNVRLHCKRGFKNCRGVLSVVVRNGLDRPVQVVNMVVRGKLKHAAYQKVITYNFERDTIVHPGGRWEKRVVYHSTGRYTVRLNYRRGKSKPIEFLKGRYQVTNPAREKARAACRKCKGRWGGRGMMGTEGCICRTRDRGKKCIGGNDCEGVCLYTGSEPVPGTPRMRRLTGRCSEFRTRFGCHHYIPRGYKKQFPVRALVRVPRRCVD